MITGNLLGTCDLILKDLALKGRKNVITTNAQHIEYYRLKGLDQNTITPALNQLVNDGYVKQYKHAYSLLPIGEEFIQNGGYEGQKVRSQTERAEILASRELEKQVFKSVLETNESVQKLNDFTLRSLKFQRWATILSLIVAILSLIATIIVSI